MSKKNRNKNKIQDNNAGFASSSAKESAAPVRKDEKDADLRNEFKHLALTILFILALLAALYYLDREGQILEKWTGWLFGLF